MKLESPAPLLSYILRYLQYRPDCRLLLYREKLEDYRDELKVTMPRDLYAALEDDFVNIYIIYSLCQIFIIVVGLVILSAWFVAPIEITIIANRLESWSEASWIFLLAIPLYIIWTLLDWWHDSRTFTLLIGYRDFLD